MHKGNPAGGPRRRPRSGGYARGEETRSQIIGAALRVFGERGYAQASTREIARQAGVNPPALQYYFGGKDGLHRACAEFIIERAGVTLAPALLRAGEALEERSEAAALRALDVLLEALTDSLVQAGSSTWSRFIVRGRSDRAGPGMELLYARLGAPMIQKLAELLARLLGGSPESDVIRLRTLMIIGQVHWVHASKDHAMKFMQWPSLDAKKVALIKRVVRQHTHAVLAAAMKAQSHSGS